MPAARRPNSAAEQSGLTEATIGAVVETFYAACRADPVLGPVFAEHVGDWDAHLARIRSFWSAVLLGQPGYAGRPLHAHLSIGGLGPHHFSVWLRLFDRAVREHCTPEQGAVLMGTAGRMAKGIIAASEKRRPLAG
jgi:hemoglobin